jgi:hypothetical protein
MATLTRGAIEQVLGPVDEELAAELAQTGATQAELREAHAWVTSDDALVNDLRPLPSGRVASLIEILEKLEGPQVEDE